MKKSTPGLSKLKFLADESFGIKAYQHLLAKGLDILSVSKISPGAPDIKVLTLAAKEKRILITLDKDFGNLVFVQKIHLVGVIFLRLRKETSDNKIQAVEYLLANFSNKITGSFITYKEGKIRFRKIPDISLSSY